MEEQKRERYVNPYTDFGFKKLFGTELNKDLLISLLNALFDHSAQQMPGKPKQVVKDLRYLPTEKLESYGERQTVYKTFLLHYYCSLWLDFVVVSPHSLLSQKKVWHYYRQIITCYLCSMP